MIRGMQEREREVLLKVRHREAGFHTLLQALQHRMQLLELHLVDAQRAAGLPVSIPPPPPNLNLGGLLSVGFADSIQPPPLGDLAEQLELGQQSLLDSSELKEELDKAIPPHEPLDTSAARSRADLASRGGMALRQSPSQVLLRRSGGDRGASMSSTSSLEHSFIEEQQSTRLEEVSGTESASNQFHEVYFRNTTTSSSSMSSNRSQQQQQIYGTSSTPQQVYGTTTTHQQQQYYQQQQQQHYHQQQQQGSIPANKPEEHYHYDHQHFSRQQPQQHLNDHLKQLIADRNQFNPADARHQPGNSSNRSMGRAAAPPPQPPAIPPHNNPSNVFYPADVRVESQLRSSMRTSNSTGAVSESISSSAASISSSTTNTTPSSSSYNAGSAANFNQLPVSEWNVEHVGNWLRFIGNKLIISNVENVNLCLFKFYAGLDAYVVHFAANGVRGEELLTMESIRIKLLVPQAAERGRLKQKLKELRSAADKDKRHRERERKEREKLERRAIRLAEKAEKEKVKKK